MKRTIGVFLFVLLMLTVFVGCSAPDESSYDDRQNKIVASGVDGSNITFVYYKLYVNGVDLFEGEKDLSLTSRFCSEYRMAQLPLFRVLEELGATVTWESDTVAKITYNDNNYIFEKDGSSVRLGDDFESDPENGIYSNDNYLILAPGSTYGYCKMENDECFVSQSMILLLFHYNDVTMHTSYEGNIPIITING